MNRAMNKLFERDEGTSLRIGQTGNMESWNLGHLQVHDHALRKGYEWQIEGTDYGRYPSGHPIGLSVWVESADECEKVCKLMEDYGFARDFLSKDKSSGFAGCDWRDRSELDSRLLADFACSILRDFWGITAKKEIVCHFDHDEEKSSATLQSQDDLTKCLAVVSTHEPKNATLNIYTKADDQIIQIERAMHGTLRIGVSPAIADEEKHSRIKGLLQKAGYVRDAEYGDDCWLGREDADFVLSVLNNVLHTGGIKLESDRLRADLHLKRRFT